MKLEKKILKTCQSKKKITIKRIKIISDRRKNQMKDKFTKNSILKIISNKININIKNKKQI
jgi:hypothetical protein